MLHYLNQPPLSTHSQIHIVWWQRSIDSSGTSHSTKSTLKQTILQRSYDYDTVLSLDIWHFMVVIIIITVICVIAYFGLASALSLLFHIPQGFRIRNAHKWIVNLKNKDEYNLPRVPNPPSLSNGSLRQSTAFSNRFDNTQFSSISKSSL